jgi:hypothetical protein
MPTFTTYDNFVAFFVDACLILHDGGYRLERYIEIDVFTITDASLYTTGVICFCSDAIACFIEFVIVL